MTFLRTQFIVVERCRGCGVCGHGYDPAVLLSDSEKHADFSAVSPMFDLAKRFAEDVKQLQGDLGLIAKVQAQMEAVLKSTHGDCSQAAANLEQVAAGANATPENNAENEHSDPETHFDTQKLCDDVEKAVAEGDLDVTSKDLTANETNRRHGKESTECETIAAGKKSKKKKKKASPEKNFLDDVGRRCGGDEGLDGETVAAKTGLDKSESGKPFEFDKDVGIPTKSEGIENDEPERTAVLYDGAKASSEHNADQHQQLSELIAMASGKERKMLAAAQRADKFREQLREAEAYEKLCVSLLTGRPKLQCKGHSSKKQKASAKLERRQR